MLSKKLILTDEVVDAINEELEYTSTLQDQGRADKADYGVEGQLLTLKHYTDKAISEWVMNPGSHEALHELRKCASIAVRALITHGCPRRFESQPFDSSLCLSDCTRCSGKFCEDHGHLRCDCDCLARHTANVKVGAANRETKELKRLWSLLDDISTAGDMYKPEQNSYFKYVTRKCESRDGIISSDGHVLFVDGKQT